jgi:hypothetical protein
MKHLIWGKDKAKYFCGEDWTTQISLNRLRKFDFRASDFAGFFGVASGPTSEQAACRQIALAPRPN